jgi:HEPN domain-containing protein
MYEHAELFMSRACQYYVTARFAMHAQCLPVCANLFHHAVEMFLKGGLARNTSSLT